MKYYVVTDNDNYVVNAFVTNDNREGITISKTQYNKIKWEKNKAYKLSGSTITVEDVEPDLEEKKAEREREVNSATKVSILAGFEYPVDSGNIHQFDQEAQSNLIALNSMASGGLISGDIEMTLANGDFVVIPNAEIVQFTATGFAHKDNLLAQNKILRKQIRACTTIAELDEL